MNFSIKSLTLEFEGFLKKNLFKNIDILVTTGAGGFVASGTGGGSPLAKNK